MHLLPRPPHRIWLLAAAAWLAGCALLWTVMPVAPEFNATWAINHLGFTPDGQNSLVMNIVVTTEAPAMPPRQSLKLELRSATSNELVADLGEFRLGHFGPIKSADGRFWILRESDELDAERNEIMARFARLDIATRTMTRSSVSRAVLQDRDVHSVSFEGRFCVLRDITEQSPALLWDFEDSSGRARAIDIRTLVAFSRDRRFLAAESKSQRGHISVVELETAAVRQLNGPGDSPWPYSGTPPNLAEHIRISADGSRVAAEFNSQGTSCWNVETGKLELRTPKQLIDFAMDGDAVIVEEFRDTGRTTDVIELPTGNCRVSFQSPASQHDVYGQRSQLSIDGRALLVQNQEMRVRHAWTRSIGLGNSFFGWDRRIHCRLYDLQTGKSIGDFGIGSTSRQGFVKYSQTAFREIPSGRIAILEGDDSPTWAIWNVPPRKSGSAFAACAAILAALIGVIVLWRLRRRRLSVAESP